MKDREMKELDRKKKEIEDIAKDVKETNERLKDEQRELSNLRNELNNSRTEFDKHLKEQKARTFKKESPLVTPISSRREFEGTGHFETGPLNKRNEVATFAEKVQEEQSKDKSDDESLQRSPNNKFLEEVSPINQESSISHKKFSNDELLKFEPQEIEVPLDFGESKKSPKEIIDPPDTIDDDDELEKKIAEDVELYDPSYYVCEEVFKFSEHMKDYTLYQVLKAENAAIGYLIFGCEMIKLNKEYAIRLFCFRDKGGDPSECEEYKIGLSSLYVAMKVINAKDVIPHDKPNKMIRDFREFIKRFVFSFLMYKREGNIPGDKETIQFKSNTKGVLKRELQVKFFKKE